MKALILAVLLFLSVPGFSQYQLFTSDTSSVSNSDTLTSNWIELSRPSDVAGQISLYLVGDKLSGTQSKQLVVEAQTHGGRGGIVEDKIGSQWQLLDSVATTYLDVTISDDGSILSGYWIDVTAKATVWNKFHGIRFRFFFKAGTHKTRIYSLAEIN